jgi:acylphosphatase
MERLYCRIYGRVQMVMMRDFVTRKAKKTGVIGYVRNMPDGSVEAYGQGDRLSLERWLAYLRSGSLLSQVEKVEAKWGSGPAEDMSQKSFDSFDIVF